MRDEQPAMTFIADFLKMELTPAFHILDLEVTSVTSASSARLRGNGF